MEGNRLCGMVIESMRGDALCMSSLLWEEAVETVELGYVDGEE
jgi:hypothetical protein